MARDWVTTRDVAVKTLEKEFIPYGIALRLFQLGFNEPCFAFYSNQIAGRNFYLVVGSIVNQQEQYHGQICSAPLWQQAFKWFRDKGFQGSVDGSEDSATWKIVSTHLDTAKQSDNVSDYNEAQIACLLELINIYLQYLNA